MIASPIPHFAQVAPEIYRGGQPETDEQWGFLETLGVRTVIKLNLDSEGSDEGALDHNLLLVATPINKVRQVLTEPEVQTLLDTARLIDRHTYVHCTHGQDRTGLQIGYYRVLCNGWSKADAYAEMRDHGFHPLLLGLSKAWSDLPERQLS